MAKFEITAPDGKRYEVTAPDGASQDEVLAYAKQQFGATQPVAKDNTTSRSLGDIAGDAAVTALKGAVALPEAFVGLADIPTGGRVGKALDDVGVKFGETQKTLDTFYSAPQQEANRKVQQAKGFVDTTLTALDNPSTIITSIGESIPQMIGGAGLARLGIKGAAALGGKVAPWLAGALGEGAIGAGSAAEGMRQESPDQLLSGKQSVAALGSGLGTAAFGAAGGKLANKFGFGDMDTILAQGGPDALAAGAAKKGFLRQVVEGGISEGVFEELPQSIQETMWQNWATDKPLFEGTGHAGAMGMLAGMGMGMGGGGYNAALGRSGQDATPTPPPVGTPPSSIPPAAAGTSPLAAPPPLNQANPGASVFPDVNESIQADELVQSDADNPVDRMAELDAEYANLQARKQELNDPANGYGPMFDTDRAEIFTRQMEIAQERAELELGRTAPPVDVAPTTAPLNTTQTAAASMDEVRRQNEQRIQRMIDLAASRGDFEPVKTLPTGTPVVGNRAVSSIPSGRIAQVLDATTNPNERIALEQEMARRGMEVPVAVDPAPTVQEIAAKTASSPIESTARTLNEDGRATDGKPINPGDVFRTLSGRNATPYPKQKSEKYASQWLIENATAEAESRGDNFNALTFKNSKPLKDGTLTTADREGMLMYLFSQQPDVVPSILKPLTGEAIAPKPSQPAQKESQAQGAEGKTESALDRALRSVGIDPNAPVEPAKELRRKAEKLMKEATAMLDRIPPGQPISSARDRNLREKSAEKARKASDLYAEAERLEILKNGMESSDKTSQIKGQNSSTDNSKKERIQADTRSNREQKETKTGFDETDSTKPDEVSAFDQRYPNIAAAEQAIKAKKLKQVAVFKDGDQYRIGARGDKKQAPSTNLIQRIKQLGGIHTRYRADVIGDKAGAPGLFSNTGKGLDDLATALQAEGFAIDTAEAGGGVDALTGLIQRAVNSGETVLNYAGQQAAAEKKIAEDFRDNLKEEIAKLGGNPARNASTQKLADMLNSLRTQLRADLEQESIAKAAQLEAIIGKELTPAEWDMLLDERNAQAFDYTQDIAAIARMEQEREAAHAVEREYEGEGAQTAGQRAGEGPRQGDSTGGGEPQAARTEAGQEDFGLTGETPEEIRAREEAQAAKAKSEQDAADKAEAEAKKKRIDAEVASRQQASAENFTLGQSAEDALAGQGDIFGQETKPDRYEIGRSLTKEQRRKAISTLVDVYKLKNAEKEERIDARGESYFAYPYQPDYFEKSDITGAMLRYYVTLPDGKIAHPSELFPDFTEADIDKEMARQRDEERAADNATKARRDTLERRMAESIHEANVLFWKSQVGTGIKPEETALLTNGTKYARTLKDNAENDVEVLGDGWKPATSTETPAGQRKATLEERIASEKASHVLDLNKAQTGWKRIDGANNEAVTLVSYDGKIAVPFLMKDKKSGTASVRMNAEAHAYAIDNPYRAAPIPEGELIAKPLYAEAETPAGKPAANYKAGDRITSEKDVFEGDIVTFDGKQWMAKVKRGDRIPLLPFVDGKPIVSADTVRKPSVRDYEITHTGTNYYGHGGQPKPVQPAANTSTPAQKAPDSAESDYKDRIHTLDVHEDLFKRVTAGTVTADEFKASFEALLKNKDAIVTALSAMTKDAIFKRFPGLAYRYKNEKKADVVKTAYRSMLDNFVLGNSISWSMGEKYEDVIRGYVERTNDQALADHAADLDKARAERSANREQAMAGMADPQTLEDFGRLMNAKAQEMGDGTTYQQVRMTLTPEQRARFDELAGEKTRTERKARADQQKTTVSAPSEAVGASEIIKTKHTKHGHDLWQFTLERRVPPDEFKTLVAQAKRMGGDYSSYRGNGAIPGWQFRSEDAAIAFRKLVAGDTTAAQEVMQARRDAFQDDKSQSAVERLNEMAERLEGQAAEALGRDRKANTARRARFAASAEAAANSDKALAKTMRNIAQAIADGKAKFLDRVRQKAQVEMLRGFVRSAKDDELRQKYPAYIDYEKHQGEKPTGETADHAKFPSYTAFRSDLASLGRQLEQIDGTRKLGASLLKVADDVTSAYLKFAKENLHKVSTFSRGEGKPAIFASKEQAEEAIKRSGFKGKAVVLPFKRGQNIIIMSPSAAKENGIWPGDDDKRITLTADFGAELVEKVKAMGRANRVSLPWIFESAYDARKRLSALGIETPAEFRAALREFIALQEQPAAPDKIKEMERAMIGRRKDGLDFFPTPQSVAQDMIEAAELEEGMAVLEPSAGMGHIADQIRAAGVEPDVVEMSGERRELLDAKGYNLIGADFMDMSPRGFTYGDVFRHKDGREGIMRGSGGMGSGRVGFIPDGNTDRQREWVDRDDLTGVRKTGANSGYDRIIMNPPFSDRRDIEHVRHAYELLRPGGRLVAIMGEGSFFGSDKKATEFREWLESLNGTSEKLEDGAFLDPTLPVNTGVAARMVVIDKPNDIQLSRAIRTGDFILIENPTRDQAENLLRRSKYQSMRGLRDPETGKLYIWDANDAIHHQVARELGITDDVYERLEFDDVGALRKGVFSGEHGYGGVITDRPSAYEVREIRMSRQGGAAKGIALRDLNAMVDRVRKSMDNLPTVHVLTSPMALDLNNPSQARLREFIEQVGALEDVEGAAHEGKIYLFASGLADEARAEHVLAVHEITHYGLRAVFGMDLDPVLQSIWATNANIRKQATALREKLGLTSNVAAVEEILADMEPAELVKLTGWRRLAQVVRDWFRGHGFTALADRIDSLLKAGLDGQRQADLLVAEVVNAARGWVKGGKRAGKVASGTALQRVWHGTPHIWAPEPGFPHGRPRLDKIGTGEGAQAYGWGFYTAQEQDVGVGYKNRLTGDIMKRQRDVASAVAAAKWFTHPKLVVKGKTYYDRMELQDDIASDRLGSMDMPDGVRKVFVDKLLEEEAGSLYQLDIPDATLPYLLDWDRPLSEQTPEVRKALTKSGIIDLDKNIGPSVSGEVRYLGWTKNIGTLRGEELYKRIVDGNFNQASEVTSTARKGSEKAASEYLASIGIVGNRYLDGQSRNRPLKDIKREFLAELPEDADASEVAELIGTGKFSPKNDALLRALRDDDWLGFDYPAQAVSTALGKDLSGYDASPELIRAVADAKEGGTYNYVIWDQPTLDKIALLERNGEKLDAMREADAQFSRKLADDLPAQEKWLNTEARMRGFQDIEDLAAKDYKVFENLAKLWREKHPADVMLSRVKPSSLKEFLNNSKVRHVVYHATKADFDVFDTERSDLGAHFGTLEQANRIAVGMRLDNAEGTNIMPVWLSIKNPLRLKDVGSFHADGIADQLERKGLLNKGEGKRIIKEIDANWRLRKKYDPMMRKIIEDAGYDGVVYSNTQEGKGDSYIVFHPEQIKSATGNKGTFDPANPDIRLSRSGQSQLPGVQQSPPATPPSQQSANLQGGASGNQSVFNTPEPSKMDDIIFKLQDKHIDLKRAIQGITDAGRQIADKWNTYMQEELFHGRTAKRVQDFADLELAPMLREMALRKVSIAELDKYLWARHAKEANALIEQRDPGVMVDDVTGQPKGSGMTDQEADDYFAGLSQEQRNQLDAIARQVDRMIARTRDLYVSYGLENRDTVQGWADMFQHYVPLMREDHDGGMGIGQGFSIKGREAKHRTGSTRAVADVLANIATQRERAIVRGEKNRVAVSLAGLVKLNPAPDFWTLDKIPQERVLNEQTGLVETREMPNYRTRDNVIIAKIKDSNGNVQERAIVLNENDERAVRLAKSMKNIDIPMLEGWLGSAAAVTRYFSAINTQYNPVFGVVNLIRDTGTGALNLSSTALKGNERVVTNPRRIASAVAGIYSDARKERKGQVGTSPWAALWEEFTEEGGQTGYRDMFRTSNERANAMQQVMDPTSWTESKWGKFFTANGALKVPLVTIQKAATPLFNWLSDFNLAMENAVRLSAYKEAIDSGMSKQQAASLAKNLTVNFNRKGAWGAQAGALYAFFNAATQGTARIGETLTRRDHATGKYSISGIGKKIIGGGVMLGVMQAFALAMAGYDDDEPPEFIRERNIVVPLMDGKYISIPMPLGFHVIPNIGRIATETLMGRRGSAIEGVIDLMGITFEAFNPMGSAGWSTQTVLPTVFDPMAAIIENKDWTGKPIAKEKFSNTDPEPGYAMAKDNASSVSTAIAYAINLATGGSEYTAGKISPTPDQIDYLWGQVTGGVGREGNKLYQSVESMFTGEELPPHKIPLAGRLYGNTQSSSAMNSRFYDNIRDMKRHKAEYMGRMEDGDTEGAQQYLADNPEAEMIRAVGAYESKVQQLRSAKRKAIEQGDSERAKEIEQRTKELMEQFNQQIGSAKQ